MHPSWGGVSKPAVPPLTPPPPPGMGSAGRCSSSTDTRGSRATSCSKVRQGQQGRGTGLGATDTADRLCPAQGAHGKVDVVVGETDYRNFAILYLQRAQQLSVKLYGASTREPRLHTPGAIWVGSGEPQWTHRPFPSSLPVSDPLLLSQGPRVEPQWCEGGMGRGRVCPQSARPHAPQWVPRTPGALCSAVRSLPASDAALSAFEQRVQRADLTEDHILFFPNYGECPRWPASPLFMPHPGHADPCLGPQVSVRPQTSSTSWMVSGQNKLGSGGAALRAAH